MSSAPASAGTSFDTEAVERKRLSEPPPSRVICTPKTVHKKERARIIFFVIESLEKAMLFLNGDYP